ncbi:hypothetical protein KFK09_012839 [Dendrobium nobile]|uniref:Uncharacterized protein n=1 Tax=Dendrobium nobile TaxID=94219 RepID=A0A8T3BJZ6_DENNO|nr:hypothetical protein KFK09_012839 [Dendrobium nobile]
MAVEIAGTCLHWSQPPHLRGPISAKTVAHAISSLLHTSLSNSHDRVITHNTAHHTPFLGTALLHHCHQRELVRGGRKRVSCSANLDGFVDGGENEEELLKRVNELNLKFKIEAESQRIQDAETSNSCDESAPSSSSSSSSCLEEIHSIPPASDSISPLPISINPEIPAMPPESWAGSDGFALQKMERRANSFDIPLSLRILQSKKKRCESDEMTDSVCSSVKKAFSSMVFIVRELQSQVIRMREALLSSDNFQIQETLARVHSELHASFVWLFHRIFSSTPTLMVYLMLLLANFTVFSITDHHAATAPLPPPQSFSASIEESQNPTPRFNSSTIKTFSVCRSSAVGGNGSGGGKPPAITASADDGSDRSSSSLGDGGMIFSKAISMAAMDEETATAWKGIVDNTAEMIMASGRHESLMDPHTLRRFVSPVTVEAEPDDLSAYSATELSYRVSLSENPDDALLLSNFAQFLYTVRRDHDRAEEYFKRALRAEPAEAETLCRYANFLWVARKDLGAAEETFLEAISADPANSYYSANYAHFLWSTGGEDTCYPLDDRDT